MHATQHKAFHLIHRAAIVVEKHNGSEQLLVALLSLCCPAQGSVNLANIVDNGHGLLYGTLES